MAEAFLTYMPAIESLQIESADVYSGKTATPGGPNTLRTANVSMLLTGTFMEGLRNRINQYFGYSHIAVLDPAIEVHDLYIGAAVTPAYFSANPPDFFAIPAGQTSNYWVVVFSFVTTIPGLGKRKVVLLDRWSVPGSWTTTV
jgi:hypothetical protein